MPKWNEMIKNINGNIIVRDVEVSQMQNEPEEIKKMIVGFPTFMLNGVLIAKCYYQIGLI